MTNEQKIIEACIRANKEIIELKFGCKVKLKQRGDDGIVLQGAYGEWIYYNYDSKEVFVRKFDKNEILGREILPQDILTILPHGWMLKYDKGIKCFEFINVISSKNEYFCWKGKNLSDQTEKTYEHIVSLLPE